jgi:soluble lytic murein transglycosylase
LFKKLGKRRLILIIIGLAVSAAASLPPFMIASCQTRQQTPAELRALENLRTLTRGGALPAEDAVARIESDYPRTKTAGLARLVRARIKINAKDFAGAAALLDASVIRDYTALGDYAFLMRGEALEQAGQKVQARLAYEKLAHDYPASLRSREAILREADLLLQAGDASTAPKVLQDLTAKDDGAALLLAAKAYEQASDPTQALTFYHRVYYYAPAAAESAAATTAITRLGATTSPASAAEAVARADKLYEAKKYADAAAAYGDAFTRFPATINAPAQLRRGIAASIAKKNPDAIAALNSIPAAAGETRAEAFCYLAQTYAHARQWDRARATVEEMRREFAKSSWTPRTFASLAQIAADARDDADAYYFSLAGVNAYPGAVEVAPAQFNLAWAAHEAKNYAESARLLTEHLALYADKNTDNRGRAGYWAARDSERTGKLAEARALYQAMQGRYAANWYGYLAKQRLDAITRKGNPPPPNFAADSLVGRAVANLQTVTVAEETAGPEADVPITKADQLSNIGLDDWALEETARVSAGAPFSPRINLATARIYRSQEDNVRALNTLKKSYPDYSQMKPDELTRDEWDVFYPLAYWDIIAQESRTRNLDPFQVAGLIRQETVFNSHAKSSANAYGLMQLLVPTGRLTAKKYGVERPITADSLYEPRLNIQLGTAYLRDQIDKFGRIEYVAAAYNAGPTRVPQWIASLPAEIDEWAEAVPFKETRGYIQGVVRNRLQYERLYDPNGKFRAEVGTHPVSGAPASTQGMPAIEPANSTVHKRRVLGNEEE